MPLAIIALIGFFVLIFYLVNEDNKQKEKKLQFNSNRLDHIKSKLENFKITNEHVSELIDNAILIDEENNKFCVVWDDLGKYKIYSYSDILESEIVEDGKSVTKTRRSSQIGGALIGGALAGGVGAVIGGLSAKTESDNEVISVDLKLVVNDTENPLHLINFLKASVDDLNGKPIPIKTKERNYINAKAKINHWHSLMTVLINKADKEDKQNQTLPDIDDKNNYSSVDEIQKLVDLYNEGFLTRDEFNTEKQKILNK